MNRQTFVVSLKQGMPEHIQKSYKIEFKKTNNIVAGSYFYIYSTVSPCKVLHAKKASMLQ